MSTQGTGTRSVIYRIVAVISGLISAFFVFYEARLLYVTHGLTEIRTGGQGAYIGAVAFPVLAILFGIVAWRCNKAARKSSLQKTSD